jgi:pimeloyl-ACP methyl ester carboxylesterase
MTQLALARPDGTEIRASVRGEGWPVLAFNGATLPLEFWDPVVAETEHVLRWLRFDARNVGGTRAAGGFSLEDIAADGAALLDHVGVEAAIVVGHAWGGRSAQVLVRDHAERVRGLVLVGSGGRHPAAVDAKAQYLLRRARRDGLRDAWEAALSDLYCGPAFRGSSPEAFAHLADLLWNTPSRSAAHWDAAASPLEEWWGTSTVPTLLVYGAADRFGTPENAADLQARIADVRLRLFEGAGHFLPQERFRELALELVAFTQRLAEEEMAP